MRHQKRRIIGAMTALALLAPVGINTAAADTAPEATSEITVFSQLPQYGIIGVTSPITPHQPGF